ncbi:MAG: hypothetical protein V5A20_14030 [Salinibacter sp.]|uniref:hypothetical protein n=2 Tax=Salinibacter sp. TaxID=2065818 RepID=UPI002FC30083
MWYRLAVLTLVLALPPSAHAQWDVEATAFTRVGVQDNVFKSPDQLLQNQSMLGTDSLVRRDAIYQHGGDIEVERALGARHEVAVEYDAALQHYTTFSSQNEREHDLALRYAHDAPGPLTLQLEVDRRWNRSVGTSVLGDELTRLFSYRHWEMNPQLEWGLSEMASLTLDYRRRWRTYDTQAGLAPLSYNDHRLQLISWLRFREADRPQWVFLQASVREKQYRDYQARDLDGQQDPSHPTNTLRYASLRAKYNMDVSDTFSWGIGTKLRRRVDAFKGYYNYQYARLDGEIEWDVRPSTTVKLEAKWRHYRYDEKSAATPEEPLRYNYVDGALHLTHRLRPYLHLVGRVSTDRRISNVGDVSRRTRRSYAVHTVTTGLRIDVERLYRQMR